jgi:hypothetical protein
MEDVSINKYWYRSKLATAAVILSLAILAFAVSSGLAPCSRVFAQSTSCNAGDTETFTGATSFTDSVAITGAITVGGDATFSDEINVGAAPGPGSANQVLASAGAAAPPEWTSLGDLLTGGGPTYVYKTADEDHNGYPAQNDDHLFFAVEADSLYALIITLKTMPLGSSSSMYWNATAPTGTEYDCQYTYYDGLSAAPRGPYNHIENSGDKAMYGAFMPVIHCAIDTGVNAGTWQFKWFGGGNFRLEEGSWLQYVKLN